eukprot:UN34731
MDPNDIFAQFLLEVEEVLSSNFRVVDVEGGKTLAVPEHQNHKVLEIGFNYCYNFTILLIMSYSLP